MIDLPQEVVDHQAGIVPAFVRVLAINLQETDLDPASQCFLDSLESSLSIDWLASEIPTRETEKSQGYDLVIIARSPLSIPWSEAVAFKQVTGAVWSYSWKGMSLMMSSQASLPRQPGFGGYRTIGFLWCCPG